jgi:hypothetical protein
MAHTRLIVPLALALLAAAAPAAAQPQGGTVATDPCTGRPVVTPPAPAPDPVPPAPPAVIPPVEVVTVDGPVCRYAGSSFLLSDAAARADTVPVDRRRARINRQAMELGVSERGDQVRLGPAAGVSIPTALGVDAGELFFGIAYQGRTRYTTEDDAAAVLGIGIGTRRVVALEAALTTYSTLRGGGPLETGGVSLKLHRAVGGQTSVAVGVENALLWGGSDGDPSLYAVASRMLNLRDDPSAPFSTAVATVGVGNGRFRFEEDDAADRQTVNVFGGLGVRVAGPLSLVADWTGQDLNAAASVTPFPRFPLVLTAGMVDLTGSAGDGARFIVSLGYGLAFRQPF